MSANETPILEADAEAQAAQDRKLKVRRKRLFLLLGGLVLKGALTYAWYEHAVAARYVTTDNAYTAAETAQVTPAIGGIVAAVHVTDTQKVRQGDVLVAIDDTDARLALAQAEAELGRAQRKVRGYTASDDNYAAQIAAATAELERARVELKRREALVGSGSVSGEELTRARSAVDSAVANRDAALGARQANAVLIAGATEDTNPEVALARAKRDQAKVNLERTVIRAPVDGVVAKRTVQVGQQVQAGSALLSVVPLADVHVDANFKEGQLDKVRAGQPVKVTSDLYGKKVEYTGTVEGLAGGTGSVFAAIPAQNATGNWIKVVQRVPVRVKLDEKELAERPLQIGLSMNVTIDTKSDAN